MRWEDWNRLLIPLSKTRPSWRTFSWAARKLSIVWYSNFLIPQPLGFAQLECPLYGVHFSEKGNDLTNTLKIQRIPINLTLALAKVTTKTVKRTKPRRRIALQRGSLMRWNSRNAWFNKVFVRMFLRFRIMRYGTGYAIPHFLSREWPLNGQILRYGYRWFQFPVTVCRCSCQVHGR